jgi:hypothetical protein
MLGVHTVESGKVHFPHPPADYWYGVLRLS